MNRTFLITGSLFGALSVALGAWGAHGLQQYTRDEQILHGFNTAVQYQMYHALAVAFLFEKFPARFIKLAGNFFITGIILFSGSLYALTILKISGSSLVKIMGPVTPIGGVFFIAGWVLLFATFIRK
jgi:uncharacterized membrane protein YgdD (TMEM256/DUF423 family)